MFTLDPVLQNNTFHVCELSLCTVRLSNNAYYPWLILIPKREGASEIIDLNAEDRKILMDEICMVSDYIKHEFLPEKINVAALGNQVKQLHIHIIGRYKEDQAWPGPVWDKGVLKYEDKYLSMMVDRLSGIKTHDV
jgi:diadenosine tetraphosphate (Ap4A) HIT family hydrolase